MDHKNEAKISQIWALYIFVPVQARICAVVIGWCSMESRSCLAYRLWLIHLPDTAVNHDITLAFYSLCR